MNSFKFKPGGFSIKIVHGKFNKFLEVLKRHSEHYESFLNGGFKTNIEELNKNKEDDFDIFVSAKMFDNEEEMLLNSLNVKMLSNSAIDKIMESYMPRGQTAIRDALGNSLNYFLEKYKEEHFESCIIP